MAMLQRQLAESQQQSRAATPAASTREVERKQYPQYPIPVEAQPGTSTATRLELETLKLTLIISG